MLLFCQRCGWKLFQLKGYWYCPNSHCHHFTHVHPKPEGDTV